MTYLFNGPPAVDAQSGALLVSQGNPDFTSSAAAGLIPGATVAFAIGHVSGLSTSTGPVDICEQGTIYPFLSSASLLGFTSASVHDTVQGNGTGAQVVLIQGLDGGYNQIEETVQMNGTTPVVTVYQYLRVNLVAVMQAGSNGTNVGDITIQAQLNNSVQGIIRAGVGDNQQAVYTIPNGFVGILTSAQYSIAGQITSAYGQVALTANVFGQSARVLGVRSDLLSGFPYNEAVLIGYPNPAQTDVTARVLSVGQDNSEISGGFTILLLDLDYFPAAGALTRGGG
jgi:hypothetical protein